MRRQLPAATVGLLVCLAAAAWAGSKEEPPPADQPGRVAVQRWRVGMVITAEGGGFKKIVGMTTVPMDWPEQRVRIVGQDLSPGVNVSYQVIEGAARQMVVRVPSLQPGKEARAVVTFEIRRLLPAPPEDTEGFQAPHPKRPDRKLSVYLAPSPYIESDNPAIKAAARETTAGKEKAWERVEAIYDCVREKIQYKDNRGGKVRSAAEALADGVGDCDEMTSLFVAMCRSADIPARTVRVPGHCYPEFYLLDKDGQGRWFPCQATGTRSFGGMPDPRPILQKGDNVAAIDPATKKKVKHRFLPETLMGLPTGGGGSLSPRLVCEQVENP